MKQLYLEFVRGVASVFVLIYHLVEEGPHESASRKFSLSALGADSVIMFFILSGIVIHISQSRRPRPGGAFLVNRLLRIVPQFLLGLLLGLLVSRLVGLAWPSAGQLLGNFLMLSTLQGFIVTSLSGNSVVWSLTFEMFFYLVFMLSIGRHQKKVLVSWLIASLAALPFAYFRPGIGVIDHCIAMLAFSCIWLVGYYTYEFRRRFSASGYSAALSLGTLSMLTRIEFSWQFPGQDPVKYLLFALVAIPFFRFCLQTDAAGKKAGVLLMAVVYLAAAAAFLGLSGSNPITKIFCLGLGPGLFLTYALLERWGLKARVITWVDRLGAVLGKYSYSLYIGHVPILIFFAHTFRHNPLAYLLCSLPCILVLTYCLESLFQPAVLNLLKMRRGGQPAGQIPKQPQ